MSPAYKQKMIVLYSPWKGPILIKRGENKPSLAWRRQVAAMKGED